jgi:hypothetical protein
VSQHLLAARGVLHPQIAIERSVADCFGQMHFADRFITIDNCAGDLLDGDNFNDRQANITGIAK